MHEYPIFISYRHADTADKAEHLLSLLEASGYKGRVSFDRENLDGRFDLEILRRLDNCTDFIVILGSHTLDALSEDDIDWYRKLALCSPKEFPQIEDDMKKCGTHLDFVRFEIARALAKGKHIIPIVPVSTDDYNFDRLALPEDICLLLKHQAEKYQDSKHFLFKDILPRIIKRLYVRPDKIRLLKSVSVAAVVAVLIGGIVAMIRWRNESENFAQCRTLADFHQMQKYSWGFYDRHCRDSIEVFETLIGNGFTEINDAQNTGSEEYVRVKWSEDCSLDQIRILKHVINNMMLVPEGEFMMGSDIQQGLETAPHKVIIGSGYYIGKFEVTEREWNIVMDDNAQGDVRLPKAGVSWIDCQEFVRRLQYLTGNLTFTIPSESQWEYAARYGESDGWLYAGGANPEEVAHFNNADGPQRECLNPNALELYNMSGNVAEWCSDGNIDAAKQIIRGGSYDSDCTMITTTYADAVSVDSRLPQVGLRIVLLI